MPYPVAPAERTRHLSAPFKAVRHHVRVIEGRGDFKPQGATSRRWQVQRLPLVVLVVALLLGDLGRTFVRGDWTVDGVFWLCGLALLAGLAIFAPVVSRRRGRHRADEAGALFAGGVQLTAKAVDPPEPIRQALAKVHKTMVFGRSKLDADVLAGSLLVFPTELRWVPGQIAKARGALPWSLNWDAVETVEVGKTPLAVRSWNADVSFVGGGSISMQIMDADGLRAALRRTPLLGSDRT